MNRYLLLAALSLGLGLLNSTSAQAQNSNTIYGCYNNSNGQLRRVTQPTECKNNETALSWNTQGPKGDKGDTGAQGVPGPQGVKGDTGAQGAPGAQGVQGPQGDKGDQGAQGLKGDTGEKGDKGEPGPQGIQGLQGAPGPAGPSDYVFTGNIDLSGMPTSYLGWAAPTGRSQPQSHFISVMTFVPPGNLTVKEFRVQLFDVNGASFAIFPTTFFLTFINDANIIVSNTGCTIPAGGFQCFASQVAIPPDHKVVIHVNTGADLGSRSAVFRWVAGQP